MMSPIVAGPVAKHDLDTLGELLKVIGDPERAKATLDRIAEAQRQLAEQMAELTERDIEVANRLDQRTADLNERETALNRFAGREWD